MLGLMSFGIVWQGDSRSLQMAATSQYNETGLAEVLIFAVTHLSEDAIFLRK